MAAEGVCPHAGPCLLAEGTSRHQNPVVRIEEITGEAQVQRRFIVMHRGLGRRSGRSPIVVEEHHKLFVSRHRHVGHPS